MERKKKENSRVGSARFVLRRCFYLNAVSRFFSPKRHRFTDTVPPSKTRASLLVVLGGRYRGPLRRAPRVVLGGRYRGALRRAPRVVRRGPLRRGRRVARQREDPRGRRRVRGAPRAALRCPPGFGGPAVVFH